MPYKKSTQKKYGANPMGKKKKAKKVNKRKSNYAK
jgi:hypothetical protein|tara:strand:+ start:3157 stop:3261 length:105 start_codon:yes stop_codon:yes gene_type:complete